MTAGYDGNIMIWDIERGVCQQTFQKPGPHYNPEFGEVQTESETCNQITEGR